MKTVQYTIRGIPEPVDKVLRKRARLNKESFNKTLIRQLSQGISDSPGKDPFDELFGASILDEKFDQAIADMRRPDKKLWPKP